MNRLAVAEVVVAAAGVALAAGALASPAAAARLLPLAGPALAALALWIAAHDARTLTIPDGAILALAAIAVALRLAGRDFGAALPLLAADALLCGGALLLLREAFWRLRGLDALGLGDVKLAAACGLLLGTAGFAGALLAASLAGLAAAGLATLGGRDMRRAKMPFGALLAPAAVVVWWAAG